jgi:hypothetical protein
MEAFESKLTGDEDRNVDGSGDPRGSPMGNGVLTLIVDESKWLTASLAVALLAVVLAMRRDRSAVPGRQKRLAAMSLFFALVVGTMAFGHLLAVTVKLTLGTLEGSILRFYLIGLALAVPSWWLVVHTPQLLAGTPHRIATLGLHAWVVGTLLVMGLHNLPLAAPGLINIAYIVQSRRVVGWLLVALFVSINVALFAGSLVFLASGQSFEQFRGME